LREVGLYIYIFLALALVEGEWSASLLGYFTARGSAPNTYRATKDKWAPESVWITWETRKILPLLGLELYPLVIQLCLLHCPVEWQKGTINVVHWNSESLETIRVLKEENVLNDGKENNTDNEWKRWMYRPMFFGLSTSWR
jgi:hypothetical protein